MPRWCRSYHDTVDTQGLFSLPLLQGLPDAVKSSDLCSEEHFWLPHENRKYAAIKTWTDLSFGRSTERASGLLDPAEGPLHPRLKSRWVPVAPQSLLCHWDTPPYPGPCFVSTHFGSQSRGGTLETTAVEEVEEKHFHCR